MFITNPRKNCSAEHARLWFLRCALCGEEACMDCVDDFRRFIVLRRMRHPSRRDNATLKPVTQNWRFAGES